MSNLEFVPSSTADEETENLADMDMSTSPTSCSPAPFPAGASDALPNVNLVSSHLTPWVVMPGISTSAPFGLTMMTDSPSTMYMMMGQLNPYPYTGEPNDGCATSSTFYGPRQKETVQLRNAVMYPPNPNVSFPQPRDRPPGCRTVFVGGLPEKCTEEILRELLARCGEIQSIRMSRKHFAHVRFVHHESVERAFYFSGYRMKVEDKSDKEYTGRIHIDYAQARDDVHEWEMSQRSHDREGRSNRSESPLASDYFNETEAASLLENLKGTETFKEASQLLLSWLDKGECNKKTSTLFYGMIAAVNSHVKRLLHERRHSEDELREFREKHNQKMQDLMGQLCQIEKIFRLARKQKNWDHFSRAQRKNVEAWLKHAEVIRKTNEDALLRDRHEEEMETSDDSDVDSSQHNPKRFKSDSDHQWQLRYNELLEKNAALKAELEEINGAKGSKDKDGDRLLERQDRPDASSRVKDSNQSAVPISGNVQFTSEMESRIVALLSCFLNVHPTGANIDYLWAYLRQFIPVVRAADIETILDRFPHLFQLQSSGVGAAFERRWMFTGFQT